MLHAQAHDAGRGTQEGRCHVNRAVMWYTTFRSVTLKSKDTDSMGLIWIMSWRGGPNMFQVL